MQEDALPVELDTERQSPPLLSSLERETHLKVPPRHGGVPEQHAVLLVARRGGVLVLGLPAPHTA